MNQFPTLTEAAIRARASEQSYSRGYSYFRDGLVQDLVWRDGILTADVQGSDYNPYQVQVLFEGNAIVDATCTCPYDWGGDCKHIVATLFALLKTPNAVVIRESLELLLADLNADQLRTLLFDAAEYAPKILDYLEQRVTLMRRAASTNLDPLKAAAPVNAPPPVTFNAALLQRQIKADVRMVARSTDEYDESYDDSNLAESLDPAIRLAQQFLDAGDAPGALEVLKAAAEAFREATDNLDAYVLEVHEDMIDEQLLSFAKIWTEAFLVVEWTHDQKIYWLEELEEFIESMFGGGALLMAQTALQQGWTYPPLVAAMRGEFDEHGAWADEAPDYADDLAEIRLRILGKRGDWESYLNLAKAEGLFLPYLQTLINLGRNQQAFDEACNLLISPDSVLQIAKIFAQVGDVARAIELSRVGLFSEESSNKANLASWAREYAATQGDDTLALQAAEIAFRSHISLQNYLAWQQQAGTLWGVIKQQAFKIVADHRYAATTEIIEIYLHEKMYAELIALVDASSLWYYDLSKVIYAVQHDFPDWAIQRSLKQAEQIMNAGKATEYDAAVNWLKIARDIMLQIGKKQDWQMYLNSIKQTHARKYKLMNLLKAL